MRLLHVVGARPNYMKAAAVIGAARRAGMEQVLVHTGQHYGERMSDQFFADLALPPPDHHLGVGSGTHAEVTGRVMIALEPVIARTRPDWVVVVGDVNSTAAAALTASKLGVRVAHVEAGLRSFDRSMPEELNRVVTDALADLLLTPSPDADANLRNEGRPSQAIRFVGNVMIDMLDAHLARARARDVPGRLRLERRKYAVATLHRAGNVDQPAALARLMALLGQVAAKLPVVFPVHPRTRARLDGSPRAIAPGVRLTEPLGYLDFVGLLDGARLALTDSGGIQEETTVLGIPCLTLRDSTERPITLTEGTNTLVGADGARLGPALDAALRSDRTPRRPRGWDGRAAERVVRALAAPGG
jgi:UDP-N-acetylglucosamine 2-epimerase (non-hydrolysing)